MAFLCLRVDLDYVPWDTPDANEFGHGEPAMFLRLLDLARLRGDRFQFFVSNRVLRAFPATAEAVLNEGHDLDWFAKHPERFEETQALFGEIGHKPVGMSVKDTWPPSGEVPPIITFLSSMPGPAPSNIKHFPVETKSDRDAARHGITTRAWTDTLKGEIREAASRNHPITISIRPQVMAKFDPKLAHLKELLDLARAVELPIRTLRQAL